MSYQRPERIELTRTELYEKVWSTPMMHLSQEYDLSGSGLAKICKRHKIPRPPRGFWAKKRHGITVRQILLPKIKDSKLEKVVIYKGVRQEDESLNSEANADIIFERQPENLIVVPFTQQESLPIIERTSKSLHAAKPNERSLVRPRAKKALDVTVRKISIDRAMLIMDALLKAFKTRGYSFTTEDQDYSRVMRVEVQGETIEFQLLDVVRQRKREFTSEEKRRHKDDWWYLYTNRFEYVPLDRLELRITTYLGDGIRRTWGDGKSRKLEDLLNAFLIGLIKASEALKELARQREIWEREREQRRLRAAEERRLVEQENARIKALNEALSNWHTSQLIRDYVQAVHLAEIQHSGEIRSGSDIGKWIDWASVHADKLDPRKTLPRYRVT